jgi:hypothetical protein
MSNKKMIIIPSLSSFGNTLGIHGRKIRAAVFMPNKINYPDLSLLESSLYQLKFLEIVGWFTNEKGFQIGVHRLKRLHDICIKGEIDMVICYSKEDLLEYESSLVYIDKPIKKYATSFYCIKDCTLIKADEIIPLL